MSRLLLLFVLVPLVELSILIRIGELIGFWPTVGIVVLTAMIGSTLARREGLSAFVRFQEALAGRRQLGVELLDGLIILASAVLLLTPGILTDVVGLLGLFPATRPLVRTLIKRNFNVTIVAPAERGTNWSNRPPESAASETNTTSAPGQSDYETTMSGTATKTPSYQNSSADRPD